MRSIVFILVFVLLSHHSSCNGISSANQHVSLNDMSAEIKLNILEHLDFAGLLDISFTCEEYSILASDVVRRKFRDIEIRISVRQTLPKYSRQEGNETIYFRLPMQTFASAVEIYDYDLAQLVLRKFGHVIQKMSIYAYFMEPHQLHTISALVSELCSSTLVKLKVRTADENRLPLFVRPFPQLTDVSLGILENATNSIPTLNHTFPNVERLSLEFYSEEMHEFGFMDCDLPYLESLKVDASLVSREQTEIHLERFLRRNSHIKNVYLIGLTPEFLNVVNRCLPQLVGLSTDRFALQNDLRFDHVERFELRSRPTTTVAALVFPCLDEVKLVYSDRSFTQWMSFFRKHSNVSRLWFDEVSNREHHIDNQFESILEQIPRLETIEAIFRTTTIAAESIVRIIENHTELKEIQIRSKYFNEDYKNLIIERFAGDWIVDDVDGLMDIYQGFKLTKK